MPGEQDRDDDPDDVAIDDGGGDDGGDSGVVLPASGHREQRPARVYSEATRKLFRDAASALKSQIDDEDDDLYDSVGSDEDPADEPIATGAPGGDAGGSSARTASTPVAPQATPAAPAAVPPPAAAPPAAPSLDPAIIAERERLAARAAELDRREQEVTARSSTAIERFSERYLEDSAGAVLDLIKEITGASTDDQVREAVADLVVDLSSGVLKLQVGADIRAATDGRRALRAVNAHKAQLKKQKEQEDAAAKKAQETAGEQRAIAAIGREFATAVAEFPHLAAEDDPGGFIFDVIKARHAATGEQLDWRAAARLAEASFEAYTDAFVAKRRDLIARRIAPPAAAAAGTGAAPANNGSATRERPNQGQGRRTVTNGMAAAATAHVDVDQQQQTDGRSLTREERRAATKAKMRAHFRAQQREENAQ